MRPTDTMNPPPMTSLLSNRAISSCETRGRPLYLFWKVSPGSGERQGIYIIKSGHFHWKSSCCLLQQVKRTKACKIKRGVKCSHVALSTSCIFCILQNTGYDMFLLSTKSAKRQRCLWHFQWTSHYFVLEKARVMFTIRTHNSHRLYCATHLCVDYETYIGWHFNTLVILVIPHTGNNNKPEPLLSCSLLWQIFENRAERS